MALELPPEKHNEDYDDEGGKDNGDDPPLAKNSLKLVKWPKTIQNLFENGSNTVQKRSETIRMLHVCRGVSI